LVAFYVNPSQDADKNPIANWHLVRLGIISNKDGAQVMPKHISVSIDRDVDRRLTALILDVSHSIGRVVTKKEAVTAIVNAALIDPEAKAKSINLLINP
jgi:hypothetical protein